MSPADCGPDLHRPTALDCRPHCGACCIAPSISTPMPGLPHGKPAGVRCPHLQADERCALFGDPRRPAVCGSLQPSREMCRETRAEALSGLTALERQTRPDASADGPEAVSMGNL